MTKIANLIAEIKAADAMSEAQLLELRRATGADMEVDAAEADALFELNHITSKPKSWDDYFVMVITTYLVHQGQPAGYINDGMAAWLIARIDHDGVVETDSELRLLMSILKMAKQPGDRLEAYAIKQVKEAVLTGRGRVGRDHLVPGVIGRAEVEMLRRIFYSVGGDGGVSISKMEAEEIFALNEATKGRDNDPEWQRFFVGAIANYLMMIAAPPKMDIDEVQRRDEWLEAKSGANLGWDNISVSNIISAFKDVFGGRSGTNFDDPNGGHSILQESATKSAERITQNEAKWLIDALTVDGEIDANEQALLNFIRQECPAIDDSLRPWFNAA